MGHAGGEGAGRSARLFDVYAVREDEAMQRFGTTTYVLCRQPHPGERESRFRQAKDCAFKRPREGKSHV